jgi:hypothetical protein
MTVEDGAAISVESARCWRSNPNEQGKAMTSLILKNKMKTSFSSARNHHRPLTITAVSMALAAMVTACGGGNGSSGSNAITLSGTAATGAPMVGAKVVITDANNKEVQNCNNTAICTVADDGQFKVTLQTDAKAPFVLRATPTSGGLTQVSMTTSTESAIVNITPISTMVAAWAADSRDPALLKASDLDAAKLEAAKSTILKALQPLLDAAGSTVDPLTGSFKTDGTGLDRALDALSVQIVKTSDGKTEVVAEIKLNGDSTQPASITLSSDNSQPVSTNTDTITSEKLPASGLSPKLQAFAQALTACFNLPYADRVDTSTSPVSIKATQCKSLFHNADPVQYLSNGNKVGPNGSFKGMHSNRDTHGPGGVKNTVTFDNPVYEFTRTEGGTNGDVVMTVHWRDSWGNEDWERMVLRHSADGSVLRLIGNQYLYDARVNPMSQRRHFVQNESAGMSYDSTGYNTWVNNHIDANGNPLFDRVVLTTPTGQQLTLKPNAASNRLGHVKPDGTVSNTPVIRMQWAFLDSYGRTGPTTGKDIADLDTSLLFVRNSNSAAAPWDDAAIKAIANHTKWKYDFYLAGNTGSTPNTTQWVTTLARAQTLGEMRASPFARLGDEVTAQASSAILTQWNGIHLANSIVDLTEPDQSPVWAVPANAVAPTSIGINGTFFPNYSSNSGTGRSSFSDGASVSSTARSGIIYCSRQSQADSHCASSVGVGATGQFATGSFMSTLELWGKTDRALERSMMYTFYKVVP